VGSLGAVFWVVAQTLHEGRKLEAAIHETAALLMLYGVGFALQMAGVFLVVQEITNDLRAAVAIKTREDESPTAPPKTIKREIQEEGVFGTLEVGGLGIEQQLQTAHSIDSFREFTAERLVGGSRGRVDGVVLFVVGAFVGLAANLVAVL
jgi:hypothetical protein